MTAQIIHIREYPKSPRERQIEQHYLGIIATMAEALHKQTRRALRAEARLKRRGARYASASASRLRHQKN